VVPGRLVEVEQAGGRRDPGVVREEVDAPEAIEGPTDGPLDVVRAGDIHLDPDGVGAALLGEGDGLGQVVVVGHVVAGGVGRLADVRGHDVRAVLGVPEDVGPSLAAGCARDERDRSVEVVLDHVHRLDTAERR
jgi:hypothetical protein